MLYPCTTLWLLFVMVFYVGAGSRVVTSTLAGPVGTGVAVIKGKEGNGIGLVGDGVGVAVGVAVPVDTGVAVGLMEEMEVMAGHGGLSRVLSCCVRRAWP